MTTAGRQRCLVVAPAFLVFCLLTMCLTLPRPSQAALSTTTTTSGLFSNDIRPDEIQQQQQLVDAGLMGVDLLAASSSSSSSSVGAVDYDAMLCRNSLIPLLWNATSHKPEPIRLFRVLVDQTLSMAFQLNASAACPYAVLSFSSYNKKATDIQLTDTSLPFVNLTQNNGWFVNVTVTGKLIGYTAVKVTVHDPFEPSSVLYSDCDGALAQTCRYIGVCFFIQTTADDVYKYISIIFVVLCQIDIGLRTKWSHIKKICKAPIPAILGLSCHYILMPLVSFSVAKIIEVGSQEIAMGFFLSGIVAGGGLSNLHSQVLGGDFQLSCIMTYASQILSLGFTPLWIAVFEPLVVPDGLDAYIPFAEIATAIAEFLAPAVAGFTFRHLLPKYGHFIQKYITLPTVLLLFIYYCTYGLYTYQWMFQLFTPAVILCGCLLPYFGFILSGLIALAARQPKDVVITIMMETAFQNVAIALSIVQLSISDPIISTLSLVGPYSVLIFSQVPIVLVEIVGIFYRKCLPRIRERLTGEIAHTKLDDGKQLLDEDAYEELTESNYPVSGSQFDDAESSMMSTSDETKMFFERKKDYFGKDLIS